MKRITLFLLVFLMFACNIPQDNLLGDASKTQVSSQEYQKPGKSRDPLVYSEATKEYWNSAKCPEPEFKLPETGDPLKDFDSMFGDGISELDELFTRMNNIHDNNWTYDMSKYSDVESSRKRAWEKSYTISSYIECLENPETRDQVNTEKFRKTSSDGIELVSKCIKDVSELHSIINLEELTPEKAEEWRRIKSDIQGLENVFSVDIPKTLAMIEFEVPAMPEVETKELGWLNPADSNRLFRARKKTPEGIAHSIRLKNESIRKRLEDAARK